MGLIIKKFNEQQKGYWCSYHTIEELETEATFSSSNATTLCPPGIIRSANLHTGVAFHNFDRYVETADVKDTLHDTVGIIYQNIPTQSKDEEHEAENVVFSAF